MRSNNLRSTMKTVVLVAATALLLGAGVAGAQQQINLSAGPAMAAMPDGTSVPMWGYSCGAPVMGSTATCAASNQNAGTGWSPVVITVPTGQGLQINLTNNLTFGANNIPTSLTIVGQVGGGLGNTPARVASPAHVPYGVTWPVANTGPDFVPPAQSDRVQSFGTEVPAGTMVSLPPWTAPRPGTYLLESGTHPSIQGTMGLYGIVVVTSAPTTSGPGTAYPGVNYNAEVPLIFSEIDPLQNKAVSAAVNIAGFSETATHVLSNGGLSVNLSINVTAGGSGYVSPPTVTLAGGGATTQATATATIDTVAGSPTQGQVIGITVTGAGSGYATNPTVSIVSAGDGAGATATPTLSFNLTGSSACGTAAACYPPVVNYTPLYYLINGVAFDKTNSSNSLFAAKQGAATGTISGNLLVRMVNAGAHMHVPSIVGSTTQAQQPNKAPATLAGGFSLIAEDGNPLPGLARVQSEVFMSAGKTYDVMINAPAVCTPVAPATTCTSLALPVYDRELSLSASSTNRDSGMLAYIGVNGSTLPTAGALTGAKANADSYSVVPNVTLTVSDPGKGVIANDVNVFGVKVSAPPAFGTLTLNANGTFTYIPSSVWASGTTDTFGYCANGSTYTSSNPACTIVSLAYEAAEGAGGISVNPITYTSKVATYLKIAPSGVLSVDSDAKGYPLSVVTSTVSPLSGTGTGTISMDANGGFNASVSGPGTYTFSYYAKNSQGTVSTNAATVTLIFLPGSGLKVSVVDGKDKTTPITDYRWVIEEDKTFYVDPNNTTNHGGTTIVPTYGTNFHASNMPFVAQGCTGQLSCEGGQSIAGATVVCDQGNGACRPDVTGNGQTPVLPGQVYLDPTKRYYISVLPGDAANAFIAGNASADCSNGVPGATNCGHGMGGAPIGYNLNTNGAVTVLAQPNPYPPGQLSVFVFEDDFPLNGEQDAGGGVDVLASNEPGLGGFQIHLWDAMGGNGDFTGQMTYDMFNQPLGNSLDGTIDPVTQANACPITQAQDGTTGMVVTCPKYESDGVTLSPLAGQALIKNLMPGRFGVIATPAADRIARGEEWHQTNTLDGQKAHDSFIRIGEPTYFQEFGPAGYHVTIGFANPGIINARHDGVCAGTDAFLTATNCTNIVKGKATTERMSRTPDERLYSSGSHDSFYWTQCYVSLGDPDGEDFMFTKCDADGKFTFSGVPSGDWRVTVFDQWNDMLVDGLSTPVALVGGGQTVDLGDIAMNQWQANVYTRTFIDDNKDGISTPDEGGIPLVNTTVRYRDGSMANNLVTDMTGTANFNETFPLFNWYVVEADTTRYKNTGTHTVYDVGGPADGSASCGQTGYPACGNSTIGKFLANTYENVPLPTNLSIPGSVYCADADCTGASIQNGPTPSTGDPKTSSTGRIDNPWSGGVEGWQGFSGQNNFIEFGKEPYVAGENGGIKGHVIYASTRPFDDPQMLVQTQWEPLVPHVTINLYQEGTAADKITPTLTLVDTTQTSSWDDFAQGFRSAGIPNMNCPGQSTADLFYFTLYNQPNYLNVYDAAHGGPAVPALPDNSQFKCYDGMHNWNQLQPVPYDGMYRFPSVTATDANGKPTLAGTNCTICSADPVPSPDLYAGVPMLPVGKYVVEVVPPPGFEIVKEEDKNILIGDNFIAPVTQEFGGLGNIFILPDQASVASSQQYPGPGYNANNPQQPTQSLGASPMNGIVPGFTPDPVWPCVGESRIVPDFISLFPQSSQVSPFAGATRNLCDRKEVTLDDQAGAIAKFYVFTSTHIAAKFTGGITDDFTSEFDPFSPQFGEKFAPPNMPISIKDWTGSEISRVYSDQWGTYDGMTYSTWEVNPPNPTGYSPTMMVFCMNDPGSGPTPDPLFNPGYSDFCYELPYMPGQTQYLDTPVVPTSAFSAGYNHPDCAYPDATPAISEVDGDGRGPWVGGSHGSGALGSVTVTNGGSGYVKAPKVTFTSGGGTGATATATISGVVQPVITLNAPGTGYTSVPTVTLTGGGGTGATATAAISNIVASASVNTGGSGYTSTPTVKFTNAPGDTTGSGAHGIAVRSGSVVTAIVITIPGSGYILAPTITVSGGGASTEATATANLSGAVTSLLATAGGSGYTSPPFVTISGGGGTGAAGTASILGSVTSITLNNPGSSYTSAPTVGFNNAGTGGSGAAATASVTGGQLTITALGDLHVINYGYSGPQATAAPFNNKTLTRHYGFGSTKGTVTIGGFAVDPTTTTWGDGSITVQVPSGVLPCAVQQQSIYGGSPAKCGQLVITAANGKQSVDAVTVTIGGKSPTYVSGTAPLTQYGPGAIQQAIDEAMPGDLIMVPPGTYNEMLIMWKPVRLQGVGAASSIINANTQPAGKLDPWRAQMQCLFGLGADGTPHNISCPNQGNMTGFSASNSDPQVDRLPLEGIVGWDTTVNGNLAQLLQEPTLLGAYEGAGITVLSKGVKIPAGTSTYATGNEAAFPTGTVVLNSPYIPGQPVNLADCTSKGTNPYPSNFQCNPSSIDAFTITDASQGGGGIYAHAWAHNLQIANNRIYGNIGTLSGGINIGQGESPDAYLAGTPSDSDPGSCVVDSSLRDANKQMPYCFDMNVNVHNNAVTSNTSIGDELFSGTPAGAGGVTFCTGADYYKFNYNWICGNQSTGDGGGLAHIGFSYNGDIEHNTIIFNQSTNPTIQTNGGGIIAMGAAPDGMTAAGVECGGTIADADCPPGLSDGTGPNLVINANLLMGNAADSGSGGGLRLQDVNGTEVSLWPTHPENWNSVSVTNNIIANNVAGWDGGGVSLQDALEVNFINNTVVSNDSTASSGALFNTLGSPLASSPGATNQTQTNNSNNSEPQPAGLVTMTNSSVLTASFAGIGPITCPAGNYAGNTAKNGNCTSVSYPYIANDIFWQNHSYQIGVGGLSTAYQQNIVTLYNSSFGNTVTGSAAASQPSSDSVAAAGFGTQITGGTGACTAGYSYWDIGVRGDTGPGVHSSGTTLAPTYSSLTNSSETGLGTHNLLGSSPNVVSQYCNGDRTPPEADGIGKWNVPPGVADATVPNPIFSLQPTATVDEGNNWINVNWGPLSMVNPENNSLLGNYSLAFGSPAIGKGASTLTFAPGTTAPAPPFDFFGNPRPDASAPGVDIGAVEFQVPTGSTVAFVTGGPLAFTTTQVGKTAVSQTLTLYNGGPLALSNIGIAVTPPYSISGGTCLTLTTPNTLPAPGTPGATTSCTIFVAFTPATAGEIAGSVTITGQAGTSTTNVAITGSPVGLSGTGATSYSATVTPSSLTFGSHTDGTTSTAQTLTVANTGTLPLSVGSFTFSSALFSQAGGTCSTSSLAVGATCTINVVFAPGTTAGLDNATLTIAYTDADQTGGVPATVTGSPVSLSGTGVPQPVLTSITPVLGVEGNTVPVTLKGNYLDGATAVTFSLGGVTCSNPVVTVPGTLGVGETATTSCVISGTATTGADSVTVTTPGGTSNAETFTVYGVPTLASIAPVSGARGATVPVTLTGNHLTGATAVTVAITTGTNGVTVSNIVVVNDSTVTATFTITGTATLSARTVRVTTPGGTSGTVTFTVATPTLTSIATTPPTTRPSGLRGTTVPVTLTGTTLTGTTAVTFNGAGGGGVTCTGVTSTATTVNANCAITAGATLGARTVTVTTGTVTTNSEAFTVLGATLVAPVSPTSGARGTTVPVTITGTNLTGATVVTVSGGGAAITVGAISVTTDGTTLTTTFTIPATATLSPRNITVTTPIGATNTLTGAFTVVNPPAPTLTSILPTSGSHNSTVPVTFTGNNFTATGLTVTVSGTGVTCTVTGTPTSTSATANCVITNVAARNARSVSVTNPAGPSNTLNAAFTVN